MSLATIDGQRARPGPVTSAEREARGGERRPASNPVEIDDVTLLPLEMEGDGLAHGGRSRRSMAPNRTYEPVCRVQPSAALRTTIRRVRRVP